MQPRMNVASITPWLCAAVKSRCGFLEKARLLGISGRGAAFRGW